MAKITIAGDAVVVTSNLKLDEIKTIEKYRPKALTLLGGDDGKQPVYAIGTTSGAGNINAVGASFGRESHDGSGYASVTMIVKEPKGDIKEHVADSLGSAIIYLNKLEEKLPEVLAEISGEKAKVMESISVAQ